VSLAPSRTISGAPRNASRSCDVKFPSNPVAPHANGRGESGHRRDLQAPLRAQEIATA
jgi:hypothetical protein